MAKKAIVGEKVGMTQIWDDQNRAIPVTLVRVAPCRVVQVTFGAQRPSRLNKPDAGHFAKAGVDPGKRLVELRVDDSGQFSVGDEINATILSAGEKVDVTGVSKGKGFAGVMKRHNFKGLGAGHGTHKKHRSPGAIGACATPARVFKGMKMAGRMGHQQVTTLNLEVVQADADRQIILIKGAVPGPRGGLVLIRDAVRGNNGSTNGSASSKGSGS